MSNLNNAEKESFASQIAGLLKVTTTSDALKAEHFDPAALAESIETAIKSLPDLSALTAAKKQIYEAALKTENDTRDKAYTDASGAVDTAEGLLGRESPIAQNMRGLRGEMNPKRKKPTTPATDAPAGGTK